MKRRFLLQSAAALAAAPLLDQLAARGAPAGNRGRVFVLLELRGGNDGLNTVAPVDDSLYQQFRPRLALREGLPLVQGLQLHPSLAPLKPAWEAGRLAIALGVGWPQPNRSHFKAIDQWASGQPSGAGPGWLAAALQKAGSPGPLVALSPEGSAALEGGTLLALQLNLATLTAPPLTVPEPRLAGGNPVLRRLLALEEAGNRELARLLHALAPLPAGLTVPGGDLGQQVALALRLIASGIAPPVLQMSLGGFDTHSGQLQRHAQVLSRLGEALAAFDDGLQRIPARPEVTLLTTSEFGRRLRENDSGGTDHGAASVALLLGDRVPHRILGSYPSLSRLDARGDMIAVLSPPDLYRHALQL
jgi:uncharacterized protein (DUF1501 family)